METSHFPLVRASASNDRLWAMYPPGTTVGLREGIFLEKSDFYGHAGERLVRQTDVGFSSDSRLPIGGGASGGVLG